MVMLVPIWPELPFAELVPVTAPPELLLCVTDMIVPVLLPENTPLVKSAG
jgi:hypothetical protein